MLSFEKQILSIELTTNYHNLDKLTENSKGNLRNRFKNSKLFRNLNGKELNTKILLNQNRLQLLRMKYNKNWDYTKISLKYNYIKTTPKI